MQMSRNSFSRSIALAGVVAFGAIAAVPARGSAQLPHETTWSGG
jgi:hypothetical protein